MSKATTRPTMDSIRPQREDYSLDGLQDLIRASKFEAGTYLDPHRSTRHAAINEPVWFADDHIHQLSKCVAAKAEHSVNTRAHPEYDVLTSQVVVLSVDEARSIAQALMACQTLLGTDLVSLLVPPKAEDILFD